MDPQCKHPFLIVMCCRLMSIVVACPLCVHLCALGTVMGSQNLNDQPLSSFAIYVKFIKIQISKIMQIHANTVLLEST